MTLRHQKKGPIHDSVVLQVPGYALRQLFEATKRPSRAWWKGRCTCSILFHLHGIRIREKTDEMVVLTFFRLQICDEVLKNL